MLILGQAVIAKCISAPSAPSTSSQIPEDILKFYQDSGIDSLAREVRSDDLCIMQEVKKSVCVCVIIIRHK